MTKAAKKPSVLAELQKVAKGEFVIVELLEGGDVRPYYDQYGELLWFKEGAEATKIATARSRETGLKLQPRRIVNDDWRTREQRRFDTKEYVPLPWADAPWWKELSAIHGDHFPHVSVNKRAFIAYTENEDKGSADIQTILKPGRYLEKYFSKEAGAVDKELNQFMIRDLCCVFSAKHEDNILQFADTEEDMVDVYVNGPNSCMSKPAKDYPAGDLHPVSAYAAGDLQVAFIRRQGKIAARVIAWPEKKIYSQLYGDASRITPALTKLGYKKGDLQGARLKKVPIKQSGRMKAFLAPHVDNVGWVQIMEDHLIIGDAKGRTMDQVDGVTAGGGSGLTEPCGYKCDGCGRDDLPSRRVIVYAKESGEGQMCIKCSQIHLAQCSYSGDWALKSELTEVKSRGGKTVMIGPRYLSKSTFVCAGSKDRYMNDQKIELPDGTRWSTDYWSKHGKYCGACGVAIANDYTCNPNKCKTAIARQRDGLIISSVSSDTFTVYSTTGRL